MSIINTTHVATTSNSRQVRWDEPAGTFAYSAWSRADKAFTSRPVEMPFAVDIWTAQHGWEQFNGGRSVTMKLISDNLPAKPEGKATAIYSLPVYSAELSGRQELVIKGDAVTQALSDFFDMIKGKLGDPTMVPVVEIESEITDSFGSAPIFHVSGWTKRPDTWSRTIVDFTKIKD